MDAETSTCAPMTLMADARIAHKMMTAQKGLKSVLVMVTKMSSLLVSPVPAKKAIPTNPTHIAAIKVIVCQGF